MERVEKWQAKAAKEGLEMIKSSVKTGTQSSARKENRKLQL
jgi:hypothetical protein